jgi:hypothetical protein
MATARARAKAVQRLQAAHPEEWEQLYGDARVAEGLPRELSRSASANNNLLLRRRVMELEAELEELRR